jgi:TP901 family phage tail tape measure protein
VASERSVIVRIRAEIGDFRRQMQQAGQATTDMGQAATVAGQMTQRAMTQTQASAAEARAALNDAGKAAQDAAKGFGLSYNSAGQLTDQFGNMVTEAHAAELGLDTASEATREFAAQQAHAAAEAQVATTHMGRLAASARDHEEAWSTAGTTLLGFGAAVVAGVGLAIAKYAEFDKAMSEVRAATHETAGNMALLREAAISMGADTSFSAKEAADAISELSKAGVSTKDILSGGLAGALSLAAAGSLGVADAAELAATAMTQFGLEGGDIPHIADLLAAGAGKAQGSVEDIGMALKQGGLVAAQFGLSIEDTTGALAAFASAGLIGSDSGTSLKTMLLKLASPSKEAAGLMSELGIAAYDADGKFVGLTNLAGQLKEKLADSTDGTKKMTQATRDSALATIFGTDAIRGANVLYEQGAEGIATWTEAVNESGFAASTAAIKQDNLAGDLEKLGGSFDTVLIQGGGGAATALRGVVQGLESMVDGLGQVKPELLSLGVGFAGVIGGGALLGGTFLSLFPKVIETRAAFRTLQSTNAPLAAGLGKVGAAAAAAGIALAALAIIGAVGSEKKVKTTEDYANALMKVSKAADGAKASDLDSVFQDWDLFFGKTTVKANGLSESIARISNPQGADGINRWADQAFGWTGLAKSETTNIDAQLKSLGETMGDITSNGGAASAAKSFNLLTREFEANGKGAKEALDSVPGYKDALLKLGQAAGIALEPNELLELATGKIPARMEAAQKATEGQARMSEAAAASSEAFAKGLEEVGLSADGSVVSIDNFTKALFSAGLLSLSASDASIAYQGAIDSMTDSVIKNGKTLDINTEQGRNNQTAYNGIAKAAMASMEATAAETLATQGSAAAQAQLQAGLETSYNDLIKAAAQLGITGVAADEMARKALGIPKEVPIKTWVNDKASSVLESVKGKADVLDGRQVLISIREETHRVAYEQRVVQSGGNEPEGGGLYGSDRPGKRDGGLINFAKGGQYKGYAMAGYVRGPGTGTSDEINARLSNGEYVIRASKVAQYGVKTFDAYNNGYAAPSKSLAGGYGQTQFFSGYTPAAATASSSQVRTGMHVEHLEINEQQDPGATFMEFSRRARSLNP